MKDNPRKKRQAFTLVELLLAIAIIGVLSGGVIWAINVPKSLRDAYDTKRNVSKRAISSAVYQNLIDTWQMPGNNTILEGEENAKPICKQEISDQDCTDVSAVPLSVLPPEFISNLPIDPVMSVNDRCIGYTIYQQAGRPRVSAPNLGKLPGEEPISESRCGTFSGGGGEGDVCGDGSITGSEACDPSADPSGCVGGETCNASTCQCEAAAPDVCGDGTVSGDEECDPSAVPIGCNGSMDCHATACTCTVVPTCNGQTATVYVNKNNKIVINGSEVGDFSGELNGDNNPQIMVGTNGDDHIDGGNQDDIICGRGGDDDIVGGNGMDILFGEAGNDTINGENSIDIVCGGTGNDTLYGKGSNDKIDGGDGTDEIDGGNGHGDICINGEDVDDCEDTTTPIVECG